MIGVNNSTGKWKLYVSCKLNGGFFKTMKTIYQYYSKSTFFAGALLLGKKMSEEEKRQSSKSHFICISFWLHKKEKVCF